MLVLGPSDDDDDDDENNFYIPQYYLGWHKNFLSTLRSKSGCPDQEKRNIQLSLMTTEITKYNILTHF